MMALVWLRAVASSMFVPDAMVGTGGPPVVAECLPVVVVRDQGCRLRDTFPTSQMD